MFLEAGKGREGRRQCEGEGKGKGEHQGGHKRGKIYMARKMKEKGQEMVRGEKASRDSY